MGQEPAFTHPQSLRLHEPVNWMAGQKPKTPNQWFVQRHPSIFKKFGSPFLELVESDQVNPITLNPDFFAGLLGGGREQSHHVIYFEPEMQWYFRDSDHVYKPTSSEKLADLHRALLIKCAQDMPANVHKLNLFHEFRSDKTCRTIISRAKSIMAADHTFFSATSPFQRIKGTELFERLLRNLVDNMLEPKEGACLTVTQAYQIFCELSEQRNLGALKRSRFKEMMRELIRERFNLALRHDVPDSENKHQQAWRGLRLVKMDALAA